VTQSLALQKAKPLEITPLQAPIAGLSRTLAPTTTVPDVKRRDAAEARPALTSADIRRMLASPGKVREVVLLSEVLQPPMALRGRRSRSW
jgi:hypothetical protein